MLLSFAQSNRQPCSYLFSRSADTQTCGRSMMPGLYLQRRYQASLKLSTSTCHWLSRFHKRPSQVKLPHSTQTTQCRGNICSLSERTPQEEHTGCTTARWPENQDRRSVLALTLALVMVPRCAAAKVIRCHYVSSQCISGHNLSNSTGPVCVL